MAGLTVCVLGVVRCANPAVVGETVGVSSVPLDSSVLTVVFCFENGVYGGRQENGVAYSLFHAGFQGGGRSAVEE